MPLESCMLVLDNSEYMRNGDYAPTRFQAQAQAVSTVFTAKTDSNPESAVGLMTMAGKAPALLVTPTNDIGKLLSAASKAQLGGQANFQTAVQIAQLALKHRENKNQRQRIVVFVGSPLEDSQESLVKLGKRLRKNNVLVDIVTIGDEGMGNDEKLGALIEAAGGGESHLVSIPPGQHLLSDAIISSAVLFDPERPGAAASGAGGGEGGDEASMLAELEATDPELAMAIRMSIQEAEQAAARSRPAEATSSQPEASTTNATTLPATVTEPLVNANDAQAPASAAVGDRGDVSDVPADQAERQGLLSGEDVEMGGEDEDEEDEEAAIARAIAMSLENQEEEKDKKGEQ
ncbi:hypothetical protein DB88DRAFT_500572 [Papiliotrema laurentii]|uniref:VWFA domain-containing protein n=1 Tax=Papiliotrema laurentii TaxID=5418 RepID=A0AAD9CV20_PAPLA|nr:hypothetical protein DB88DRAFT_500572 [Papiliotrema laurentii]